MKRLPLVYIAGPYSNPDPVENTHATIKFADGVLASGLAIPVIPHLTMTWHLVSPKPYEAWLDYDLHLLSRCDALFRLPGDSSGADAEVAFADDRGIPVFHRPSDLRLWTQHRDHIFNNPDTQEQ